MWGAILAGVVGLYLLHRSSSAAASDVSASQVGTTSADDSSDAQTPSGGGGSSASNLPDSLITQPDPLTTQVQQNDTTNPESPQAITPAPGLNGSTFIQPPASVPGTTPGPATIEQPPPTQAPGTLNGSTFLGNR